MEEQEKDTLFLLGLAVFGSVLASALATYLQLIIVLPLTIAVFLIMVLTLLLYKKKAIHFSENVENWAFIVMLILFVISFIYLFRPS